MNSNPFAIINYSNHEELLSIRTKGIGGSDAGAIMGVNKYKTAYELWQVKTGVVTDDFITNEAIERGNRLEPILRDMFVATHTDYAVEVADYTMRSIKYPFMLANIDGLLINKKAELGVLEIKTATIHNKLILAQWDKQIPDTYYCQVLHYLAVTGYKYAVLYAWLDIYPSSEYHRQELRTYTITLDDEGVKESIDLLIKKELEFNELVVSKTPPPFISLKVNL